MRNLLLCFLLLCLCCKSQNSTGVLGVVTAPSTSAAAPRGVVLNQTAFSDLSSFTNNGATASVSSGKIVLSGGTGTFTKYLTYNALVDNDEKVVASVDYTLDATGNGIGLGKKSINPWWGSPSLEAHIDHTTGQVKIWQGGATKATSSTFLANTVGAQYRLELNINKAVVTATAYNLSAGTSASASITSDMQNSSNILLPNTSKFALYAFGGQQSVSAFKVERKSIVGADLICFGDSKTKGIGSSAIDKRYAGVLASATGKIVEVWGGNGDRTVELISNVGDIIAANPKKVLLCMGRNDMASGIAASTWQANYGSIVSQLKAAGITVVHLLPIPETSYPDQSVLTNWINSTYPSDLKINPGTGSTADGVHPNDAFYAVIAGNIKTALGW